MCIRDSNNITVNIREMIQEGNRAYFANINIYKNNCVTSGIQFKVYYSLARPVVTNVSKVWTLTENDEID